MGLPGMVFSAIAAGAVICWAVTSQGHRFRISTVGIILMVVGAIGLATSATICGQSRRPTGRRGRTYDREVTDSKRGFAAVHKEVH